MDYFFAGICLLIIVASYKFASNRYYLRRIIYLREQYKNYLKSLSDKEQNSWHFLTKLDEMKKLFMHIGFKNFTKTRMEPIGCGKATPLHADWLDNLACNNEEFVRITLQRFYEAEGFFQTRMRESYNPFYWVETILKLPSRSLIFFGVSPDSKVLPLIDLLSIFLAIISLFIAIFAFILNLPDFTGLRDVISKWIKELF
jgi:hypothetical protein